ncbi:MAG: ABC transporter ATP-binding protein [Ruminococcaceae bacterium]|nr:ABC transporter ATP-binding protein [Oscillospiraceae bacterium]
MLKIRDLHAYYGPIEALKGIDLDIKAGNITCLIGSNGAGKTTLLKAISGMIERTGSIIFNDDEELINKNSIQLARKAIVHVPEGRHIFPGLSVEQNLEVGTIAWHGFFGRKPYTEDLKSVFELFPRLEERRNQLGWSLSGGEQQMLAIGRAIMARPRVLLLDEPSMGLAPVIVADLFRRIVEINKRGTTILLVEQNAKLALEISHEAYVIEQGKIILSGRAEELRHDERIIKAYLGKLATAKKPAR